MCHGSYKEVPYTYGFFYQSAERLRVPLRVVGRGEDFEIEPRPPGTQTPCTYWQKICRLSEHIRALPREAEFVLYVDSRDCLFLRPLSAICEDFNRFNWPIVISTEKHCAPHIDPGWCERFKKYPSGSNWINTGLFMGERGALEDAFDRLKEMSELVRNDKVSSSVPFLHKDDQHLWQACYLEDSMPIRLDHESRLFCTATWVPFGDYDFTKSTSDTPVVLKNGSAPSVIHFCGSGSVAIPFFAWVLNLAPLPK